jgi:hypothetical protein
MLLSSAALVGAALLAAPGAGAVEGPDLPGMCLGRSDPGMTLTAHANGTPKYILNLETDATGDPTGVLILGRSKTRVYADDLCRFWQHMPGQEPGGGMGEDAEEGATTAHAVGIGMLADGTRVLVRTDVRVNEEGMFFRARYRVMGQHGDESVTAAADDGHDDGGHEDDSWTRIPTEGWAPLNQFNLR